jgi:DNA-binding transcriptional LysR family regulator
MGYINDIAISPIFDHLTVDGFTFFGVVFAGIEVEVVSDLIFAAGAGVSLLMEKELAAFKLQNIAVKRFSPAISDGIALVFPHGRHLSPAVAALRNFLTN